MNNNTKVQETAKLKTKVQKLFADAVAKILIRFKFPRDQFYNFIDEKLILQVKKQDPDANILAIAIRTGIDRRYVSQYLKGEIPRAKPNRMAMILEEIHWTARKFYNSTKLPKKGPFRTFQSICEQLASGVLTYNAILAELVNNGNIKDLGDKVEVVDINYNIKHDEVELSEISARQINRLTDTSIYNSNKQNRKDRYIDRTIYSTQINPKKYSRLHQEIEPLVAGYYEEINQKLISYEDDVEVGTYPQYGISFLEYRTEE
ncbi:hypothetical protein MNBD_GAMMA03-678 [hydrothermal vent metagenome]|uniref:Uncharacterized protein n=1 Tax=hydrothermal vent metagenome TaxID=652676 RepID=A0A3B0VLR5_9ZZZZ